MDHINADEKNALIYSVILLKITPFSPTLRYLIFII